jgi:hypothetical protein
LTGCGRGADPAAATEKAGPVALRIPEVPAREPIDTARLNGNVFDSICRIGNPFAVVGWDLDPNTRFLYFAGPFSGSDDGLPHPYLYMAIPAVDRARITTTLYLDRLDEAELRRRAQPHELRRFEMVHIAGLPADVDEIRRQLGEPSHSRELESGHTRLIFEREVCLGDKRLVGVYIDVDDDRLVAAKGIDHPDRLRWIASGGRPPPPDRSPTYYHDWEPREGSAQEAALAFALSLVPGEGSTIDTSTLTYQTTRYELDLAEVAIVFTSSTGQRADLAMELRAEGKKRWRVSDWRLSPPLAIGGVERDTPH